MLEVFKLSLGAGESLVKICKLRKRQLLSVTLCCGSHGLEKPEGLEREGGESSVHVPSL